MTQKPTSPQQPQPQDELSDRDLEAVSAGSRPNCSTPLNTKNANTADNFSRNG
ncbi:hypothetical protein [Novispirillum itersonii]|uniref:Uncharacterized protein n=1 Tax=Novispirillum itersonii TaxID=189 RepID=A0A7X0DLU5_NOVIT|nr:hypothetical protein [Novispirillum itersonii]MBB6210331.1 hypothetical protein [Novispirillum itersonii]